MDTSLDVVTVHGVGEAVSKKFNLLGIKTVKDLIDYYPRRYDDYSQINQITSIKPGPVTISAKIKQIKGHYVRRGMHITEAVASDKSGSVRLVWFNQPYRESATKLGSDYFISGNFEMSRNKLAIMNPAMELVSDFPVNAARIVPIYRENKGLKSNSIRKIIAGLRKEIAELPETLPESIISSNHLLARNDAVINMHFPESGKLLEYAKKRLGFEEIFGLSLASLLNKQELSSEKTHIIKFDEKIAKDFVDKLPFKLTDTQRRVAWRIFQDMQASQPMNRLVEGDVGTGKTVVATLAAAMVIKNNYQAALMAPTELLARQHAETVLKMLKSVGYEQSVILLTGSMSASQKTKARQAVKSGKAKFIIGTHALIADKVEMHNLGLVIVDEQHRFGVEQRKKIQKKADGRMPHVLSMTATPIPRTLALTLYGELDVSIIAEKPSNRSPIITKIVSPNSRSRLYEKLEAAIEQGRQVFVVCPLISDSETIDALSVEKVYATLKSKFKHRQVELLHGKMKNDYKNRTMANFAEGKADILVSTTVIEVGVDVPNATIMVIEGADRFGLAQIHQLRGRVGRGEHQGYCYLVPSDSREPSRRLRALERSSDGFKLSELDLEIRGPGAIYGQMQSGQLDLRVAKLTDVQLIENARNAAKDFIEKDYKLNDYPELNNHVRSFRSITNLN